MTQHIFRNYILKIIQHRFYKNLEIAEENKYIPV